MTDPANILSGVAAVLAAATEGPWTHRRNHKPYHIVVFGGRKAYEQGLTTSDIEKADATFIAFARNTYPEALAVIRAAEERFDAAEPFLYDYPMSQDERQFMWERLRETTIAYRAALAAFLSAARDATEAGS